MNEYLPNKKRPPRASTIRSYDSLIRNHIDPNLGTKLVDQVAREDVERVHQSLRSTPYVANRMLSLLHQAFDQAEIWGWREPLTNPTRGIERYREERRGARKAVMLSAEQMKALLEALDGDEADGGDSVACAAIRLAFWTGWRIGEVLTLEWDGLDLEGGTARLRDTKTADEEYRQLPREAIEILRAQPTVAGCPFVFPGRDARTHLTTVKKPWARIRQRASLDVLDGLGALRLHDLRHNVVSWDVSRGVPLEIAGRNVGHRSRQATEVYAHFAPDALKRAVDERSAAMHAALAGSLQS